MDKKSDSLTWSEIESYQYFNNSPTIGMNFHVFGLKPLMTEPTGTLNLSRISDINAIINIDDRIDENNPANLITIVFNLNIMRFMSGMCGKAWIP